MAQESYKCSPVQNGKLIYIHPFCWFVLVNCVFLELVDEIVVQRREKEGTVSGSGQYIGDTLGAKASSEEQRHMKGSQSSSTTVHSHLCTALRKRSAL